MVTVRLESQGMCAFCGEVVTKRGMEGHLKKCPRWQERIQAAEDSSRPVDTLWRLRVQDAYDKRYWLELEMSGSASLNTLDSYLRAIWLECCDHLSQFTIGGWGGTEIGKSRKANTVFEKGVVLRHQYDFGTTSETDIRAMSARSGKAITRHAITLLARNIPPEALCQECGQPAKWLCMQCVYEDEKPGFLCDAHVEEHPHSDYGEPMGVWNSPRMGMCGYDGPAEPPY